MTPTGQHTSAAWPFTRKPIKLALVQCFVRVQRFSRIESLSASVEFTFELSFVFVSQNVILQRLYSGELGLTFGPMAGIEWLFVQVELSFVGLEVTLVFIVFIATLVITEESLAIQVFLFYIVRGSGV